MNITIHSGFRLFDGLKFLSLLFMIFAIHQLPVTAHAAPSTQLLGISQGISSPAITSIVNFSNGFTWENPVGAAYQSQVRLTGQLDDGDGDGNNGDMGFGGEFGIGNGKYGFAAGFRTRDCEGCDSDVAAVLGGIFGGVGLGLRFAEDLYSLGIIFSPTGKHRLGLAIDMNEGSEEDDGDDVTSFGLGYSYVGQQVTLSVDASKADWDSPAIDDDIIMVTPGVSIRIDMFAASVSYDLFINDEDNTRDDDLWFGIGFGTGDWHFAFYHEYVNEWALVGSFFF